jgi:hypothetical protein
MVFIGTTDVKTVGQSIRKSAPGTILDGNIQHSLQNVPYEDAELTLRGSTPHLTKTIDPDV